MACKFSNHTSMFRRVVGNMLALLASPLLRQHWYPYYWQHMIIGQPTLLGQVTSVNLHPVLLK